MDKDPRELLDRTAAHAAEFLAGLATRPVSPGADLGRLRETLGRSLPEDGVDDVRVIDELVRDTADGLLGSAGGRFFGWVIGGGVPAALAADWLTATWDQNAAMYACGPAVAVIEEVTGEWLKELLGLPGEASFGFTTGAQAAHLTALAAARHKLLADRGWDVERRGLAGAPVVRVLTSGRQHASVERAVRLLGLGTDQLRSVGSGADGRIDLAALERELAATDAPTVVCLQAGEINTGLFDPFGEACALAAARGAWVHVDGAFGLWANVGARHRHLLDGVDRADSWTADGHKWLNVPFDSGFVFVRHPSAHRDALSTRASYLVHAADTASGTGVTPARDQLDWNPEWSRRARAVPVYAAVRALGRRGIAEMVDRCVDHARRLVAGIGELPGVEVLARPVINQGLVRFLAADGDHDAHTDRVIDRVQRDGVAWFGGTTWNGMRAMRISAVNWRTDAHAVDLAIGAVARSLTADPLTAVTDHANLGVHRRSAASRPGKP
ncbi:glutamate/tyrosine decarboxylase-like PLP-dependent enzyme [Saccharothrix tamanrassetensis]|uniref:Glutamate/tyrosine decarboxylase-like PLP-dependent enzyme n=1 Tax=Saccharothrix tamanrassetensis TaxID=1051531 RepID=A0A841CD64_9PSEU|nr:pyridoxal-dependent decarboxylase [Saccharothrix tamanrassetensis]MBB5954304.1 glutamate/tyrosine decarboxylase-like PLP-dependent enzyme [Saccharothrix tamanrassetensis]